MIGRTNQRRTINHTMVQSSPAIRSKKESALPEPVPTHRPDRDVGGHGDDFATYEEQIKSPERVRDLAEVFTPADVVQAMLDLLPDEMWTPHPAPTFLEPACGHGNFLVAILDRKLAAVTDAAHAGTLPAGSDNNALQFHALEALASIYGVDISVDNVVGGTPGHEIGARDRMLGHLRRWWGNTTGGQLTDRSPLARSARWIVEHNIQVANMLPFEPDGRPSRRDELPLVDYRWDATASTVTILTTTLGAVSQAARAETSNELSLFGPPEPVEVWNGEAFRLHEAPVPPPPPTAPQRINGKARR